MRIGACQSRRLGQHNSCPAVRTFTARTQQLGSDGEVLLALATENVHCGQLYGCAAGKSREAFASRIWQSKQMIPRSRVEP